MNCSEEHGRTHASYEGKDTLPTLTMCYRNPDTERLSKMIRNNITLIVCENHETKKTHVLQNNI